MKHENKIKLSREKTNCNLLQIFMIDKDLLFQIERLKLLGQI